MAAPVDHSLKIGFVRVLSPQILLKEAAAW
jgi:hypothetical protein